MATGKEVHINKHHAKLSIVHGEELKNQATGFNLPTLHILNAWYRVVLAYLVHVHHRLVCASTIVGLSLMGETSMIIDLI